jgi:hypothetical protein
MRYTLLAPSARRAIDYSLGVRVALLILALLPAACGATPRQLSRPVARAAPAGDRHAALWAQARGAWERRADEAALREAIRLLREVVAARDDDREAYLLLSRACFFLGDGFLVFDPRRKPELAATFEEGLAFADRGLRALSPTYEQRRRAGAAVDEAASGLGREAVPYLYWYAQNLLRWAHVEGTFTLMGEYKRSHRLMNLVEALDPGYFYGGADRYFGAFLAGAPGIAGGDLGAARTRFEKALARAPHFFETHILYAELYAVRTKDRTLYVRLLRAVTEAPPDILPEAAAENARARKKATGLLRRTEARFGLAGAAGVQIVHMDMGRN